MILRLAHTVRMRFLTVSCLVYGSMGGGGHLLNRSKCAIEVREVAKAIGKRDVRDLVVDVSKLTTGRGESD